MRNISICVLAALSLGCRNSEVTIYRISKEQARSAASPITAEKDLRWETPRDWTPRPSDGIRKASYQVEGKSGEQAEISIVALPADGGGVLSNVNRWRAQLGLAAVNDGELRRMVSRLKSRAGESLVVEMSGAAGESETRIVAAILPAHGATWFLKMMGSGSLVARTEPSFRKFIESLRFENQ